MNSRYEGRRAVETDKLEKRKEERLSGFGGKMAREEITPEVRGIESANWTELMLKQATSIAHKIKADAMCWQQDAISMLPIMGSPCLRVWVPGIRPLRQSPGLRIQLP